MHVCAECGVCVCVCVQVCTPLTLDSAHDFDMGKLSAITINANQVCQAKRSVFLFMAKNTARNAIDNNFIYEIKQHSQGEITANTHLAWHCHTLHTHPALIPHSLRTHINSST